MLATTVASNSPISKKITTITIVHKTGRPRIIDDHNNIADIRFKDLVNSMNSSVDFNEQIKIIYCKFAKNQVTKLVHQTTYAIDSNTVKEKKDGLYELILTKHQKHFEDCKLLSK